jgi:hypothetical protein
LISSATAPPEHSTSDTERSFSGRRIQLVVAGLSEERCNWSDTPSC